MAEQPFIQIQNISKSFGRNTVLDNVTLNITYSEIFGIIGRSGSGKTTLLNILIGFYKPDKGSIIFQSRDLLRDLANVKQQFGFTSQIGSFYDRLTVRENLLYFGKMYNVPDSVLRDRIPELLKLVELEDAANTLGGKLSSGMQKRLDIACSLIHDPKILILDEPTEDLDPILREEINDLMRKINKEKNVTMIITSHLLGEMEDVCNRVAILDNHKIITQGTIDQLKDTFSKSVEIILKTEARNYGYAMKQLHEYREVRDVKVIREKLYVYSQNPLYTLQNMIKILNTKKERVLEIKVNRPTLSEVFEELTKKEVKRDSAKKEVIQNVQVSQGDIKRL